MKFGILPSKDRASGSDNKPMRKIRIVGNDRSVLARLP
jgi:hypothetical protein